MNSSILYHAWGLYSHECTCEEYKDNRIILYVQAKERIRWGLQQFGVIPSEIRTLKKRHTEQRRTQRFYIVEIVRHRGTVGAWRNRGYLRVFINFLFFVGIVGVYWMIVCYGVFFAHWFMQFLCLSVSCCCDLPRWF